MSPYLGGNPAILAANMAELVTKLKERGVTLAVETQGSRWQNWLKDIDQVTLSPKPPSSKMEVNFETLDFIVSQLDPDKVTFKIPVFDDADLAPVCQRHTRTLPTRCSLLISRKS